jgi:hypothetical protein
MEQNFNGESSVATEAHDEGGTDTLTVEVQTVTRSRRCTATLHRDVHADAAAATLAARLQLPANTPYALRSSRTAGFLDDAKTLGEQVTPGERLTLTPKSHLGGGD